LTGIPKIGTKSTGSKSLQPDLKIKIGEICCFTGGLAKYYAGQSGNYGIDMIEKIMILRKRPLSRDVALKRTFTHPSFAIS